MDIVIALIFVSLTLVAAGLVFFFTRLFDGDFEHGDRLSLLPLADDDGIGDNQSEIEMDNAEKRSSNGSVDQIGSKRNKEDGTPHGSLE